MSKRILMGGIVLLAAMAAACSNSGSSSAGNQGDSATVKENLPKGGPRVGQKAMGGGNRPAPDAALQALIDEVVPRFEQKVWRNAEDDTLAYNIFVPRNAMSGAKYPLVLFMADASTPGPDITLNNGCV